MRKFLRIAIGKNWLEALVSALYLSSLGVAIASNFRSWVFWPLFVSAMVLQFLPNYIHNVHQRALAEKTEESPDEDGR